MLFSTELMPKCRCFDLSFHTQDRSEEAYSFSSDSVCVLGISTTQVLSLCVGLPLIFRNLQTCRTLRVSAQSMSCAQHCMACLMCIALQCQVCGSTSTGVCSIHSICADSGKLIIGSGRLFLRKDDGYHYHAGFPDDTASWYTSARKRVLE